MRSLNLFKHRILDSGFGVLGVDMVSTARFFSDSTPLSVIYCAMCFPFFFSGKINAGVFFPVEENFTQENFTPGFRHVGNSKRKINKNCWSCSMCCMEKRFFLKRWKTSTGAFTTFLHFLQVRRDRGVDPHLNSSVTTTSIFFSNHWNIFRTRF